MVITKLSDPKLPLSRAVKESTSSRQRIISARAKEMGQGESFSRMRHFDPRQESKSNDLELFRGWISNFCALMMFRSSLKVQMIFVLEF